MAANPRALAKALVAANPTPSNLPVGGFGGAPATLPAGQLSPMVASYEAWTNGRSNGPGLPRDWSAFLAGSFGPLAPIQPISIDNPEPGMERPDPRRYQYQVGWNMPIGPPGSEGLKLATFPQLRTIADTYSVARACINLRKQELVGLEWDIIPTKAAEKKMRGHISDRQEWDSRRARMMRFFRKPDSNYFSFASWFSAQLEDVFAVDALSLYMHPSRMRGKGVMGSDLAAFELIDGTTIRPMIDVHGAKPTPPNPAYQQFIYGVPRVDLMTVMSGDDIKDMGEAKYRQYTGDQLMYLPYDARDWTPYGFAPVEKALVPILSGLNRQNWQLEYFSEGSIPGLFITNGDANATPQQNREFQDALNAMAGDPAWKHKIIVLPGGSQTMPQTPADLAGQFDEMIMGQVCMAFDVMPMELGITPGRSTSGHSGGAVNQMGKLSTEAQHRKANTPLLHRMMEIYDYIIQVVAHQDDMRFMFEGLGEIEDEATQINNLVNEVSHGLKSIDEARIIRGEQPWGLPITSDPVLVIATGLIPLKGLDPVTGQPPQPIMPAAPTGPGGAPAGPGGPPPAGGPSAGQLVAPKPAPQPTAPAAAATPAHAGATTAGPTSSNKQATDTGNDGEAPAHVNTFAALRELDLIGRRLTKGVSIAGWRREHIPADMFTTLTGPGAVADARQLLKGIDRAQRKTDAVTESTRAVSEGLRMLAGGLSNGRIAPATFVDRAVTTIRNGIRTALGNGAGHARADGISKVAIPAGFEGRFQLYAGAIFKAYEQGYGLATYGGADDPDNIVVRWHAKPGACVLCGPRDGGLYTIGGLPGFPGDGGFGKSATICVGGPNCRCALSYEKLAPGEARPADNNGTPTPVQQQIAAAVSAASKALHGPDPETAFSRVLDNHADQLAELQRPYVTGLYQDVLAARNDQQAQDTVEATYTRAPDGGPGWLVPTAVVSALIAAELYTQAQSQQHAAPVTATGTTAPATTKAFSPDELRGPDGRWLSIGDAVHDLKKVAADVRDGHEPAATKLLAGGVSAITEELRLHDGRKVVRKSGQGKRGAHAEQGASLIGRALGIDMPRVYHDNKDTLYHSVYMDHVGEGAKTGERLYRTRATHEHIGSNPDHNSDSGLRIALLDMLTSNHDRSGSQGGNVMYRPGSPTHIPIDNGDAFKGFGKLPMSDFTEAHLIDDPDWDPDTAVLKDNRLTPHDIAVTRQRLRALRPRFERMGRSEWLDHALTTLDKIEPHATGTRDVIGAALSIGKSAGPAVPPSTITAQLSRNYPADALGWVGGARWIGPVHLPTDAVDVDSVNQWTASHQPGRVGHFAAELRTDPESVRPVIAVHEPGETNVKIVDGHHRYLAARQDGQPVTAYIGQVDSNSGPWDELHTHQIHQGDDPENKAAYADLMKVGPKGYIHGWIFVGAHPKVGRIVRQTKRDTNGKVVTVRTGRVSAVADGHVHVAWDDGKKNVVQHVHEPGRKGSLTARRDHAEAAKVPNPNGRTAKEPKPEPKPEPRPKPERKAPERKAEPRAKPKAEPKAAPEPKADRGPTSEPGDFAAHIASGVKARRKLSGGTQGETSRVEFHSGHHAIHKVIKSEKFRSAKDQLDAEELASRLAAKLDVRAARVHRTGENESYQELMPGLTATGAFPEEKMAVGIGTPAKHQRLNDLVKSDEGIRLGLFDILTANPDRHGANWLVGPDGKPTAIDHGLAFQGNGAGNAALTGRGGFRFNFLDKKTYDLGDNPLTAADVASVRTRLNGLRSEFARLGRTDWYDQMVARLDDVAAHAKGTRNILS